MKRTCDFVVSGAFASRLCAVGLMDATSNEGCWENSKLAAKKKSKHDFME